MVRNGCPDSVTMYFAICLDQLYDVNKGLGLDLIKAYCYYETDHDLLAKLGSTKLVFNYRNKQSYFSD